MSTAHWMFLLISLCAMMKTAPCSRSGRHLVYLHRTARVQFIVGFGIPVGLPHQAINIGCILKCNYNMPINATQVTRPLEAFPSRRRRARGAEVDAAAAVAPEDSAAAAPATLAGSKLPPASPPPGHSSLTSRWDLYDVLQIAIEQLGGAAVGGTGSGRQCLLRAVCESAASSLQHDGIVGEVLHAVLTPSATEEPVRRHPDNEFHAAERAGRAARDSSVGPYSCRALFPACDTGALELFTRMLSF